MDFSGIEAFSVTQSTNEETGIVTFTFATTGLTPVVIGSITMEKYKVGAFMKASLEILTSIIAVPPGTNWTRRTFVDKVTKTGSTVLGAPV